MHLWTRRLCEFSLPTLSLSIDQVAIPSRLGRLSDSKPDNRASVVDFAMRVTSNNLKNLERHWSLKRQRKKQEAVEAGTAAQLLKHT